MCVLSGDSSSGSSSTADRERRVSCDVNRKPLECNLCVFSFAAMPVSARMARLDSISSSSSKDMYNISRFSNGETIPKYTSFSLSRCRLFPSQISLSVPHCLFYEFSFFSLSVCRVSPPKSTFVYRFCEFRIVKRMKQKKKNGI